MQARVIQLPTELSRLREADRLIGLWASAQDLEGPEKVVALFEWRVCALEYKRRYCGKRHRKL